MNNDEKDFRINCDKATSFLESCFDQENPDDGLSFDERVLSRMDSLDPDVRRIVEKTIKEE